MTYTLALRRDHGQDVVAVVHPYNGMTVYTERGRLTDPIEGARMMARARAWAARHSY